MLTKREFLRSAALTAAAIATTKSVPAFAQTGVTPAEARAIAKEAYIWGYALVDDHRIQYPYFIDKSASRIQRRLEHDRPQHAPLHAGRHHDPDDQLRHALLVHRRGPARRAHRDHRAAGRKERYYGCSIFDLWGHCDMFGTRTTGNDAAQLHDLRAGLEGRHAEGHQEGVLHGNHAGIGRFPHPALQSRRPRQRQEGAGRLQGADALGVPRPARAANDEGRVHQAADGRATEGRRWSSSMS